MRRKCYKVPENRDQGIGFNGSAKWRIVAVFIGTVSCDWFAPHRTQRAALAAGAALRPPAERRSVPSARLASRPCSAAGADVAPGRAHRPETRID